MRQDFEEAFGKCDLLITPTTPSLPFFPEKKGRDSYEMYLNDMFTVPSAMAGLPSLSLNCGYDEGLPVGLQIIGRPFEEGNYWDWPFLEKLWLSLLLFRYLGG